MNEPLLMRPEPAQVPPGRHVRLCPTHHLVLDDDLMCPGDHRQHRCSRWLTADTLKGRALTLTSENGDEELGLPLRAMTRVAADEEEGMPRGVRGSGPYGKPELALRGQAQPTPSQPIQKKRNKNTELLDSARFVSGKQALRVVLVQLLALLDQETKFRVSWHLRGPKGDTRGVAHACGDRDEAQAAFEREIAHAVKATWQRQVGSSSRSVPIRPIPAPERAK